MLRLLAKYLYDDGERWPRGKSNTQPPFIFGRNREYERARVQTGIQDEPNSSYLLCSVLMTELQKKEDMSSRTSAGAIEIDG